MLTAPRVYFAMAEDRLFFSGVGRLNPKTQAPIVAIVLQGVLAILIALWGGYDQILNYVVSVDFIFFGLTAVCIFVFRRRAAVARPSGSASADTIATDALPDGGATAPESARRIASVPGHPLTTILFVAACWLVVGNTVYRSPENTLLGLGLLLAGIPAFYFWRWRNSK
jgi:APA family basic amino acid/polyamine antiporter